ncbi:lamin tail domain-containing protein [Haloferula sargassicola]|uniref:lamin tail domain-containing protein n=1 Tax=Haloferula sargassicola TaxID=490096 RepID=UPI0033655DEF
MTLDASSLAVGSVSSWSNAGSLGGSFSQDSNFRRPSVEDINGVRGVSFDGNNDYLTGPDAPAAITGNGSWTVIAWVYNPSVGQEDTVVGWGRRDGPDKSNAGFFHGYHDTWGAFGGWGAGDVGWSNTEIEGAWTCATYVYDSAQGLFSCYTDGHLATAKTLGSLSIWSVDSSGDPLPIRLAAQSSSDGGVTSTNGSLSIARLRVYDAPMDAGQVAQQFAGEAGDFGLSSFFILSFGSSAPQIYAGQSVDLSWETVGATSVSLSPGVDVSGGSPVTVSPTETTTYTLTASNGSGELTSEVTVTVLPGVPEAQAGNLQVEQDGSASVTLAASDPNDPIGSLTWEIVGQPVHGSLSGTAPDLLYTPHAGYSGSDSFSFRVSDGTNLSNIATVSILVDPPPAAPSAVAVSEASFSTASVAGSFIGHLTTTDPNYGDTHTFELVAGAGDTDNARFSIAGNQLLAQGSFAGQDGSTFSIRVRVTDAGGLAYEQAIEITAVELPQSVVINEIHYDPDNNARTEFVELYNPTEEAIDLSGWQFTSGIDYTFPAFSQIEPGGYVVVAMDLAVFESQFGFTPFGPFDGKLSGDGEEVQLRDHLGQEIDSVDYGSTFPWPIGAGGSGSSMELIHPSLDNDLAGSWRSSGATGSYPELTYIATDSGGWSWRRGDSEASSPVDAWRLKGFTEDGTWTGYQSPIGYGLISSAAGTLNLNTVISGMRYNYSSIFLRKTFTIAPGEIPSQLALRFSKDDGVLIWINGTLVAERNMNTTGPSYDTFAASDSDTEGLWYDVAIANAATFLQEGENTVAVQVFNGTLGSSDLGFDMELVRPAGANSVQPTPGARNSVYSTTPPPQIRQVDHSPQQPKGGEPITITAKATDPQGIGELRLLYQIVAPGNYIPARFPRTVSEVLADPNGERPENPDFEDPANWTTMIMSDDGSDGDAVAGDGVFTAVIPGQVHRTLVRYRVEAEDLPGASVRVPYADDEALNFACFVYDGVPDFVASATSIEGAGKVWPKDLLTSIPVYHWIIRHEDMMTLQAYNSWEQFPNTGDDNVLAARRSEEWEGAFVYDGVVYDHVRTRLRGGNSRYGDNIGRYSNGKRHYKFRFNRGHYFQARDENGNLYPAKRKRLAFNRMYENKGTNGWGMPEEIGATLWRTFGVPAAYTDWIHFRVIDGSDEAPNQYDGDFWGLSQIVEEYESGFLENRDMVKGNLYKMSDWIWDSERQRRYQSPDMVSDGSEFNNIRDNLHGAQNAAWLQQYVNYDKWYHYSAVAEGIRHYDLFPYINEDYRHAMKNLAWYFEPTGSDPARGLCWFLPYDWDASFGPNWNNGWEHANNALYGWDMSVASAPAGASYVDKPDMKIEHRNVLREFRDLIWQPDQLLGLMNDRTEVIREFQKADIDRWRHAPIGSGTENDDPLTLIPSLGSYNKLQDMEDFAFNGWYGSTGPSVPNGRGAYLDSLADSADASLLPVKPTVSYTGAPGHPINGLTFQTGPFSDPQGSSTFGAMEWRVGEIEDPAAPAWEAKNDFIMEYTPVWLSGELTSFDSTLSVPAGALKPGHTYRARVRMKDNTGRWSHWSAPYEFTTTVADDLDDLQQNLMITEVMYNPAGPPPASGEEQDFEYVELQNISSTLTLDLTNVRFTKGADFDFAGSAITSLAPGEHVLVVKSLAAFEERYGTGLPVAGEWDPTQNLSNGGEQIKLSYGAGVTIHDFEYDDKAPWPTEPDGDGPAMVLVDPYSAPDHSLPESWTSAPGSPGTSGAQPDLFGDWLAQQGASDPNADAVPGLSWLMLYALGGDLLTDPLAALPTAGFLNDTDGEHLSLSFRRRSDATQLSYEVETSTDLVGWQTGPGVVETVGTPVDNGDGTVTETVRVVNPAAGEDERFIRLRVILNE